MAKIAELPIQSCLPCNRASFHSAPQAFRAYVAKNPPLYPSIGSDFRWRERRRPTRDRLSCEDARNSFSCSSSLGFPGPSHVGAIRWTTVAGYGSFQGLRDTPQDEFLLKRSGRLACASSDALSESQDAKLTQEAQEAVERVLLGAGLSREEAAVVVSNAPVYIRELVEFVTKSDSDGSAGGERDGATVQEDLDVRDRIYELANHGRGRSPFLESLGVHLPSISRISSSLSSQRLPDLLSKFRYFEEVLKESEPEGRPVDGLIEFMTKNLSISVWEDEDIQRTLFFVEKMKRQEGGMGTLQKTTVVALFLEAFPQIFKRSLENEIKPLICFLEDLGIKGAGLRKVIVCHPALLLQDPEKDLAPRKRVLRKVGIRVQDMGRMMVKYPWLLSKCVADNVDEVVQFLESIKVPKSKIDRAITRCPHLLGCSCTDTLMPTVHHINGYGLKSKRLGRAIAQSPELLLHSPAQLDTVAAFLESVGVGANDLSKLLRRSPEILGSNIDSTLRKKIEVLEDLGVRRTKLGRIIWFFPEILSLGVESALIPRIKCLRDWGFSKMEISRMTFRFPPILGYNPEAVVNPKLEFLTKSMRRPIHDVVTYPRYFSHSLEKKIKPRARVLDNRQIQCDLQTMLARSDDSFAAEFLGIESLFIPPLK